MKRLFILLTIIAAAMTIGCTNFDDTANTLNPDGTTTGSNGSGILNLSVEVTTLLASGGWGVNTGSNANTTFEGLASLATDGTNLYVASYYKIYKIVISTGVVTILAGSTTTISGHTDATGTNARFGTPYDIVIDSSNTNLYVTEYTNFYYCIRKIVISSGEVTTLLSSGGWGVNNGSNANKTFSYLRNITIDSTNLYVTEQSPSKIRKIVISTGEVTTLAGSTTGYADGTGTDAQFNQPFGITTDGENLYVTDKENYKIRKIVISTGVVTTLAGSTQGYADGTGTAAQFNTPGGITADGDNLYVTDAGNYAIRKIVISTGVVTTLAGSTSGYTDGTRTAAKFQVPFGIATDGTNLYVTETSHKRIRKIQ